jgi:Asp/Glu/hydantoin racemase
MDLVVAVYTGHGLADPLRKAFAEEVPGARLANLIDDSLLADVVAAGKVTPAVARRLVQYFLIAQGMGARVVLNTCSSVGEVVPDARRLLDIPIVRIDEPMAAQAVATARRIGVLATLPTTLGPTVRLLASEAERTGRKVTVREGLAAGAYEALVSGDPEKHDAILLETARAVGREVDAIVLAQGSMARIAARMEKETGIPVLGSVRGGIREVRRVLEEAGR